MNRENIKEWLKGCADSVCIIFVGSSPVEEREDVDREVSLEEIDDEVSARILRAGESTDGGMPEIEPGTRSDRWYDWMEAKMEENTTRSRNNEMLLQNVDTRTIWIARLLVATLAAILANNLLL